MEVLLKASVFLIFCSGDAEEIVACLKQLSSKL